MVEPCRLVVSRLLDLELETVDTFAVTTTSISAAQTLTNKQDKARTTEAIGNRDWCPLVETHGTEIMKMICSVMLGTSDVCVFL